MKKKSVFVVGIALVCIIVVGGFAVTNALLDRKGDALLAEGGSEKIGPDVWERVWHEGVMGLTASEMAVVLNDLWTGEGAPTPHEPTDGQMNMERAIEMGKAWLNGLIYKELIPERVLDYEKVNAYLEKRVPRTNTQDLEAMYLDEQNPFFKPEDVRADELLEPFFSYWTVIFEGPDTSVSIMMEAITGQVWTMRIEYLLEQEDIGKDFLAINDGIRAYFMEHNSVIFLNDQNVVFDEDGSVDMSSVIANIGASEPDGLIGLRISGGIPPVLSVGEPAVFKMELTIRAYNPKPYLWGELEGIIGEWKYTYSTKKDGTPVNFREFEVTPPKLVAHEGVIDFPTTDGTSLTGNIETHFYESTVIGTAMRHPSEPHLYSIICIATISEGQIEPSNREDLLLFDPVNDTLRYHIGGTDAYHYFVRQ